MLWYVCHSRRHWPQLFIFSIQFFLLQWFILVKCCILGPAFMHGTGNSMHAHWWISPHCSYQKQYISLILYGFQGRWNLSSMGSIEKWTCHRSAWGKYDWTPILLWHGEIGFETTSTEDDGREKRRLCWPSVVAYNWQSTFTNFWDW